jgi:hypothetical protein
MGFNLLGEVGNFIIKYGLMCQRIGQMAMKVLSRVYLII